MDGSYCKEGCDGIKEEYINMDDNSCDDSNHLEHSDYMVCENIANNQLTSHLAQYGLAGMATAAALATPRKHNRHYTFEEIPAMRKRHATRITRKLQQLIEEYNVKVGHQAVVFICSPRAGYFNTGNSLSGSSQNRSMSMSESTLANCSMGMSDSQNQSGVNSSFIFKVYGSSPLDTVIKNLRPVIINELETALENFRDNHLAAYPSITFNNIQADSLPPLMVEGIPTPLDKMTQAQLRAFIPTMLRYSTGRGKPGWGHPSCMPPWWPADVPWANVRSDVRSEAEKARVSWTAALKKVVQQCYLYHGRADLLEDPLGIMGSYDSQMGNEQVLHGHVSASGMLGMDDHSLHHNNLTMCNSDGTITTLGGRSLMHTEVSGAHMFLAADAGQQQHSIHHRNDSVMSHEHLQGREDQVSSVHGMSPSRQSSVYSLASVVTHMGNNSDTLSNENDGVDDGSESHHRYHTISPYSIKTEEIGSISFYQYASPNLSHHPPPNILELQRGVAGNSLIPKNTESTFQDIRESDKDLLSQRDSTPIQSAPIIESQIDNGSTNINHINTPGGVVSLPAGTVVQLDNSSAAAFLQFVGCVSNDLTSPSNENMLNADRKAQRKRSPSDSTCDFLSSQNKRIRTNEGKSP